MDCSFGFLKLIPQRDKQLLLTNKLLHKVKKTHIHL